MARLPDSVLEFDNQDAQARRWPKRVHKQGPTSIASYLNCNVLKELRTLLVRPQVQNATMEFNNDVDYDDDSAKARVPRFAAVYASLKQKNGSYGPEKSSKWDPGDKAAHTIARTYNSALQDQDIGKHFRVDDSLDGPESLWKIWCLLRWQNRASKWAGRSKPVRRMERKNPIALWTYPEKVVREGDESDDSDSETDSTRQTKEDENDDSDSEVDSSDQTLEALFPSAFDPPLAKLRVLWGTFDSSLAGRAGFRDEVVYDVWQLNKMDWNTFKDRLRCYFLLHRFRYDFYRLWAEKDGVKRLIAFETDFQELKDQLKIPNTSGRYDAVMDLDKLEGTEEIEWSTNRQPDIMSRTYFNAMSRLGLAKQAQEVLAEQGMRCEPNEDLQTTSKENDLSAADTEDEKSAGRDRKRRKMSPGK